MVSLSFACAVIALVIGINRATGTDSITKNKRTLCFHAYGPEERGTDVAIYDYADFAETLLGYQSKIVIPDRPDVEKCLGMAKFKKRFGDNIVYYKPDIVLDDNNQSQYFPLHSFPYEAKRLGCDYMYILKGGEQYSVPKYPDSFNVSVMPSGVHAIFTWQPHDDSIPYAGISTDVSKGDASRAVVPHIVRPPTQAYFNAVDLRAELKIPKKALVVCRHGGMGSFDIQFAYQTVFDLLRRYPEDMLHFVFLGTKVFKFGTSSSEHNSRIHHLASTADMDYKERFFKTCDVMLHARRVGESFGLAVAEFSVRNKPVVTYAGKSQEHIRILGSKGFVFSDQHKLMNIMSNFVEHGVDKTKDYNAYQDYTPEIVMKQFKKVFLDPVFGGRRAKF